MADYPQIDLTAWHPTGQGGNGTTYENPERPDVILKVNKPGLNTFEAVKKEFDVSRAVDALGISVPKMLDMVLRYEFQKSSLPERLFFAVHIRRLICKF